MVLPPGRMPVPRWGVWAESGPPPARNPARPPRREPAEASSEVRILAARSLIRTGSQRSRGGDRARRTARGGRADRRRHRPRGGTICATGLDGETGAGRRRGAATAPDFALTPVEPADAAAAAPDATSRPDEGWAAAGGAAEATGCAVGFTVGAEGDTEAAAGAVEAVARLFLGRRRLIHPLLDLLHGGRIETSQCAEFDVQPPFLNSLEQLLSLEPQFFRQLVNTRGQRQLLPDSTPDGREDHDPGNGFV